MQILKIWIILAPTVFFSTNGAIRCEFRKYLAPGNVYYVTSPGYPKHISTHVNCRWIVTTAPGFVCRLECSQFQLEESPFCVRDSFLVSRIGDPMLYDSNAYCGRQAITEVSLGPRICMSLLTARNTTGGRFLCQVITEMRGEIETSSPAVFAEITPNPKLQQPWFRAWVDSVREIASQLNFNHH